MDTYVSARILGKGFFVTPSDSVALIAAHAKVRSLHSLIVAYHPCCDDCHEYRRPFHTSRKESLV